MQQQFRVTDTARGTDRPMRGLLIPQAEPVQSGKWMN